MATQTPYRKIIKDKLNKQNANAICNQKYNMLTFIPKVFVNQFKQVFDIVLLIITLTQLIPRYRVGPIVGNIAPWLFVLAISFYKEGYDDYSRYKRDKTINNESFTVLKNKKEVKKRAADLNPGDIILLKKGDRIPADCVLLTADEKVYVQTDQLDGETDWKLKRPTVNVIGDIEMHVENPHKDIYSFIGKLKNNHEEIPLFLENILWMNMKLAVGNIVAIIIYTGKEARANLNTAQPRNKRGSIDRELDKYSLFLFFFSISVALIFSICNGSFRWGLDIIAIRYIVIFSGMIPISLKVTIDFSRMFFYTKSLETGTVRTTNIPEEMGRINYLLSDKTGTLTKNEMTMRKVHLGPISYSTELNSDIREIVKNNSTFSVEKQLIDLIYCLAICHNVTPINNIFHAASPDEVAIVTWCNEVGISLISRESDMMKLKVNNEIIDIEIFDLFPFTSDRKRMGILVKYNGKYYFYLKGADTTMRPLIIKPDWLDEEIEIMAREGLRTLVIAKRELSEEEFKDFTMKYKAAKLDINREVRMKETEDLLEQDMTVLGLTGVEDKLQDDVMITIEQLRNAGIKTWMLTGDKIETAVSIGQSTKLFLSDYLILRANNREQAFREIEYMNKNDVDYIAIDMPVLKIYLLYFSRLFISILSKKEAVIFCRCTPTQKAEVVLILREVSKKLVCSIGDGGNDISMITAADVGVGVKGKEGNGAALASDISIDEFKHLSNLLLYYGRNCYLSTTRISRYVIHRGTIFAIVQGIFCALFHFKPICLIQGVLSIAFVCFYTACPMFCLVHYVPIKKALTLQYPELYKELTDNPKLSIKEFFSWFLISFCQASTIMIGSFYFFEHELYAIIAIVFSSMVCNEFLMILLMVGIYSWRVLYACAFSLFIYILTFILGGTDLRLPDDILSFIWKVCIINIVGIFFMASQIIYKKIFYSDRIKAL